MTFCSSSAILVSNMATSSRSCAGVNSSRSGGGITHSLNRKLRSVRIQKIGPALDRRGGVTFPTHLGEPPAQCLTHGDRHGQLSAKMTAACGSCIRARGFAPISCFGDKPLKILARPAGLEPATHSLEGCCSVQLS